MRRLAFSVVLGVGVALAGVAAAGLFADSVTLQPRATALRTNEFSVGVLGEISGGAEGEYVVVKGKECGIPGAFFRAIGGATTLPGGRYEASVPIRTKTTLRAEWKEATSVTVVVTPRANIRLTKEPDGFRVSLTSETGSVDGRKVTVERFTGGSWRKLQTVVLKALPGYVQYAEKKKLRFRVPQGTTIRAVLPRSQAGACYLAGYSQLIRT
jgi:hypothetical protein